MRSFSNFKKVLLVTILIGLNGCMALGMQTIPMEKLKPEYSNEQSQFMTIDGIKIHYRDEGDKEKPALLLIHGLCSALHTWDGWVKELKNDYRIVRLDLPGFGLTGPLHNTSEFNPDTVLTLLHKFTQELKLKKFSIAGNSMGGYIAWNYTLKHPEAVNKLILIDPVGQNQDLPFILNFASHPVIRPFAKYFMPRIFFTMAVNQLYGDKSKVTKAMIVKYHTLTMREGNRKSYVSVFKLFRAMAHHKSLPAGIKKLKTRTLLMWGTEDTWVPFLPISTLWRKDLPAADFIQYEGAGHMPMEELPVLTARDAKLFLQKNNSVARNKKVLSRN